MRRYKIGWSGRKGAGKAAGAVAIRARDAVLCLGGQSVCRLFVDSELARVTYAYRRAEVLIGQRIELIGTFVAKDESTIATMVLAKSI